MHKTLIGFFFPATYNAYCTMFHGMNNQFEILRSKNGTTTVIRVIGNFTTVNSIRNDEMDWEPTVTSSSTKMVGRKINWVSQAIIAEKREKKTCFRCGNVGHKVNKCPFFLARRPVVVTVTTAMVIPFTTTTTIPKATIEKIYSKSEKK